MTEYWKSQARKYCDFCKCWLADNKVSISFHENGKRHKENVQNHISKLSKKSAKDYKQQEKMDDEIKKMEAAAMAAYLKDVENNADITSQSINAMLGNSTSKEEASSSTTTKPVALAVTTVAKPTKPLWHEVKSENGNYFWHTETNETTWDPPDDYLSLKQQEEQTLMEQEKAKKKEKEQKAVKKAKQKESANEARAQAAREQMRARAVGAPEAGAGAEPEPAAPSFGPAPFAAKPYGKWTTVVEVPVEAVDLQLPKKHVVLPPVVMQPEERPSFQEKRVESLGEGPVAFKRRKLHNPKRNARQKVDDD